MTWENLEHPIAQLVVIIDRHLMHGRGGEHGAILFVRKSFYKNLISTVNVNSNNG